MGDGLDLTKLVPIVFVAAGAVQVLRALLAMAREGAFTRGSAAVEGEVTDVRVYKRERSRGSEGGTYTVTTYAPVLRFLLPDGRQVDAESYEEVKRSPPSGARVAVRYDPEDPTRCRVDGRDAGRWGGHAGKIAGGVLIAAFGLLFLNLGRLF